MAQTAAVLDIMVKANTAQGIAGLKKTNNELRKVDKKTKESEGRVRAFSRTGNRAFGVLATGAKAGGLALGVGLVAGAKKATESAVDLGEQINKTKVVFRGSEKTVLRWSKGTATAIGISRREALAAAGTFGNMLVPMGFARKEAAGMSVRMVKLAADMASFNNANPKDTLDALRAGLAGETEPLRRFGVFLNDARLKQEALNLGLKNSVGANGALTASAKAQATYSLILKDSKDAQGDFARTSGSLANQQRILKAQVDNLAASAGKALLPALTSGARAVSQFISEVQRGEGTGGKFRAALENIGRVIANIGGVVGPAIVAIGQLGLEFLGTNRGMALLSAAIGALVGRMAALGAAFVVAKIAAFTAGITGAAGAVRALSVAIAANPLGFMAVVIGTVAGALIGMRGQTDTAKQSQQQFNTALDASKAAFDRYRTAIDAVKDSNLANRGAVLNLKAAEQNLASLRASGTASPLQIKQAEHQVAVARREVTRTTNESRTAETRKREEVAKSIGALRQYLPVLASRASRESNTIGLLRAAIQKEREAGASKEQLKGKVKALRDMMSQHAGTTSRLTARIKELRDSSIPARDKIQILRDTIKRMQEAGFGSTKQVKALKDEINRLKSKRVGVKVDVGVNWPKALKNAIPGLKPGGGFSGDGWGVDKAQAGAVSVVKKAAQGRANKLRFEDVMGGVGLLGGKAVKGSGLNAFNALATRMGLTVGSGFRPGSITSSGNLSYHAMGRARDFPGPPGKMMAFARLMASTYGSKLKELIYTPLGFSIKDGRKVPPYAQKDHYDHVHVAMQRGAMVPGSGSGDKVRALLEPGEGIINKKAVQAMGGRGAIQALNSAVPRFASGGTVARAAHAAGFRGNTLLRMVAEAKGESGWDERAVGDGGKSKGLWQIHTGWNPWAARLNLFDPFVNARAAMRIFRSQGVGAWHAEHRPHMGAAARAIASMGKGRGKGGKGKAPKRIPKKLTDKALDLRGRGVPPWNAGPGGKGIPMYSSVKGQSGGIYRFPRGTTPEEAEGAAGESGPSAAEVLAEAINNQREESKAIRASLDANTAEMRTLTALGYREALRFIADGVSGEVARSTAQRRQSPGDGRLARY